VLLVVYLLGTLWLTLGPEPADEARAVGDRIEQVRSSVRPNRPVAVDRSSTEDVGFGLGDEEVSNVLLFVPLAPLVALRWPRCWWVALPAGVGASAAIEFAQMTVFTHRGPEWDDLKHNSLGAALGFVVVGGVLASLAWRRSRGPLRFLR